MTEQKTQKFKLIDREGYINHNLVNKGLLENHMNNGVFEGLIDVDGDLIPIEGGLILITSGGFKFFEEIPVPNLEGHVTMDELQEILHAEESNEPDSVIFAPENKSQQDEGLVSKYRYTPLEVASVFDLKEHLEKGNLFCGNPRHMEKIINEYTLMNVIVKGGWRFYLREEVKWQEQITDEFGFTYVDKEDSFVQAGCTSSEDMIKFAKRVLELTGELK